VARKRRAPPEKRTGGSSGNGTQRSVDFESLGGRQTRQDSQDRKCPEKKKKKRQALGRDLLMSVPMTELGSHRGGGGWFQAQGGLNLNSANVHRKQCRVGKKSERKELYNSACNGYLPGTSAKGRGLGPKEKSHLKCHFRKEKLGRRGGNHEARRPRGVRVIPGVKGNVCKTMGNRAAAWVKRGGNFGTPCKREGHKKNSGPAFGTRLRESSKGIDTQGMDKRVRAAMPLGGTTNSENHEGEEVGHRKKKKSGHEIKEKDLQGKTDQGRGG